MRLDHAIFHAPLQPKLELADLPTPEGYRYWEADLPKKLATWRVQEGELGKSVDYGLVSNPYGFEDSPDAEWISSGVNSKGPKSMAIGRHGNWFLWGFAGDPKQMTDSGRQVFLNSICWMKQFDGKAPLVTTSAGLKPHRDEAFTHVQYARMFAKEKATSAYVRGSFPAALWEKTKGDPEQLERFYRENLEWLRCGLQHVSEDRVDGNGKASKSEYDLYVLDVDPTLAEAGVSNRKPEFFDFYVQLLGERGEEDATVRELADHYLPKEAPRKEEEFTKWLASVRDRLYFSDVYGYRWFVAPQPVVRKTADAAVKGAGSE
jgi:hypothetical protein